MKTLINDVLEQKVWAVVGATTNKSKFGYRIYRRLKEEGYEVYPVNPVYDDIEGDPCYNTVESLPITPDCVNMVVSADRGQPMLKGMLEKGVKRLWFQPGTYNSDLIKEAETMGFEVIYDACVLVELGKR